MKRRRGLSFEDREIWSRYKQSADPLHPDQPEPEPDSNPMPTPKRPRYVAPFEMGSRARPRTSGHALLPSISDQVNKAPLRMDSKTHQRMRAGKLRPEAKLDLHGMTLDVAHPALTRFILSAQAEGKRLVIVVTGKGKAKPDHGPIPTRLGVLKHQVPQWLRLAPLSGVVLQVTEAHRSHGGSGAYYVYLRR
ncbi:DNA-nicking endonuclease, Smr domain [Jannaschia faecimaris]|uniref:DNA-nicking endonuclease, Smr domain n=1 Tax=Jannaschia faecimaris TaxID=1244108 RepID=A0A1H3JJE4_9RHOB|nr:Smr/MutS family protein [Jannaschia faecimaris]SDY39538.1 DNA-nicking endonuclease, Smr domain [Jannaschia faecimaris]